MSTPVRLPAELREFLGLRGPQTLLVRGPPGSGKTTLSLALLTAFRGSRILLSGRVPNQELGREFPWLGVNDHGSIDVLDITADTGGVGRAAKASAQVARLVKDNTPRSNELQSFLWLPQPVQDAWARLRTDEPAIIVIDSWDALIESYLGRATLGDDRVPDRGQVERLLLDRIRRSPAHLVLVVEREEPSPLDYLVNAVVSTRCDIFDDRLERWLELRKLRGIRVENPHYPFTLEGARFECIEPLGPYWRLKVGRPEAEAEPMPGYLWPGSRAFADGFGRLPIGHLTLLEADSGVPHNVPLLIVTPVIAQAVRRGAPTLMISETRPRPAELWAVLKDAVSRHQFLDRVRFVASHPREGSAKPGGPRGFRGMILTPGTPGAGGEAGSSDPLGFLRKADASAVGPSLIVAEALGLHALAKTLGSHDADDGAEVVTNLVQDLLSDREVHGFVLGRTGSPLLDVFRPFAELQLRIRIRQGRVLIHGIVPWTPTFLLGEGGEGSAFSLMRVV